MAKEDKLMGKRGANPVFASYRIDYDSTKDIRFDESGNQRFTGGAVKSPRPNHHAHGVKSEYQRKLLVETALLRDDVTAFLDSEGIGYTVEDVSPTNDEKVDIADYGAINGVEASEAIDWGQSLRNASGVNDLIQTMRDSGTPGKNNRGKQ